MVFEHEFKWNEETKELIEIRKGDELINSKNEKVEGRFENQTIYPEHQARLMLKELERQLGDANISIKNKQNELDELKKKDGIVDKVFMEKLERAMARLKLKPTEEALNNTIDMKEKIQAQLENIKKVMNLE